MQKRWMMVILVGMVAALALTGCKTKRHGAGTGVEGVGPAGGEGGMYGEGLSERPEGGTEIAGQFAPVYFDYDSSQVNETERAKVDAVASSLKSSSQGGVIIEGNCDERGSTEYNLALGERRALAVRAYLVGLGIDGARIQTKSYGEERPTCQEHSEDCWAKNRRADFVLFQ